MIILVKAMKDYVIREDKNSSLVGMTATGIEDRYGITIGYLSIRMRGGCPFNAHNYELTKGSRISVMGEEDRIKKFERELKLKPEKQIN